MEANPICALARGEVARWRGLPGIKRPDLPSCLGAAVHASTYRTQSALLQWDRFEPEGARSTVWVGWFANGGDLDFVQVHPAEPGDAGSMLAGLGEPERIYRYSEEDPALEAAKPRVPEGSVVEEAIYGARGLSIVYARESTGASRVLFLRGYVPMDADAVIDEYVRLEPRPL